MKHSGKIKKTVISSVLAVSMIFTMFNFANVAGRNGPKMEEKVLEEDGGDCR